MYDPETGTLIGEQSENGKRGRRIDEDLATGGTGVKVKRAKGGTYGHEWFPEEQGGPHSRYPGYAPWDEQ